MSRSRIPTSVIQVLILLTGTVVYATGIAHAAEALSITFTSAAINNAGGTTVWQLPAPTGSNMVINASPGVASQTKQVTLKWTGYQGAQSWPKTPPAPLTIQLDNNGQASFPIKFSADSYKQWSVSACINWKPPGYDHKIEDCASAYLEGIDDLAKNAASLILIVSPEHSAPTHNWKIIPINGNLIGVALQEDLVSKSPDKLLKLHYTLASDDKTPWPMTIDKITPQKLSLAGIAGQGGWVKKSEPLMLGSSIGKWFTVRACMTIDYSGEVCSATYAYQLTDSKTAKMSDQPKDYKVDTTQPLPPVSPPPSGGGGGGGSTGKGNLMAPPPMLGAPAANIPVPATPAPQGPPTAPTMTPAVAPSPGDPGRMAPTAGVPGCAPVGGAPGQYACTTREAHAACERLRASGSSGIRACTAGSEGPRR